ncbi:uncharacterized protein LOC127122352 [Lathyrus oleraceus]|uniref:uncharacterized protein LOC127122352 n=1 Tax=Pisum sativum TaxID=3888 RepID=UPI0021CFF333|nr:uncharacterized protein LOC127122352 [Pisum sativum]
MLIILRFFRPIALVNFKFKVISKVIADRLSPIMSTIISKEQKGSVQERCIKDCIGLTSKVVNLMHNKSYGGNMICTILNSSKISVSFNGKLHGFFECGIGVRQGDPISPLLFCIAEEVLNKSLINLVIQNKIKLILGPKVFELPSHYLFADDVMVFCRGDKVTIASLINLFSRYVIYVGQMVIPQKSHIFVDSITEARMHHIANQLGFKIGHITFSYLDVHIFKGKCKPMHLRHILDKVKSKLTK